jgi:hypothetical protein
MRCTLAILLTLVLTPLAFGQNLVANPDFENGTTNWTNVRFNDPLGKHGVRIAQVLASTPSKALYADFQTLSPVMECRYDSDPFQAEAKEYPVSFDCMWEKKVTTPIPYPSVNYIQLIFRTAGSSPTTIQSYQVQVPTQTGLIERKSLTGKIKFPQQGNYIVQVFMRHSNLAGMPYFAHVDNIVVGTAGGLLVGGGAPNPGKTVDLFLQSPPDKGRFYQLGSSLGLGPIPLGSRQLNLSPDNLLLVTVNNYLPSIFVDYPGRLDSTGKAKAGIRIPNDPGLIGLRIHTAYVVLDTAAPLGIQTISNTFTFSVAK